jgi:23S rRNA U2552 (ribose-2'-O)-methylase RlmE/FtsJ
LANTVIGVDRLSMDSRDVKFASVSGYITTDITDDGGSILLHRAGVVEHDPARPIEATSEEDHAVQIALVVPPGRAEHA